MRVLLIRKLADMIDGIDLRGRETGDILDIPATDAQVLMAEQWAIPERRAVDRGEQPRQYMSRSRTQPQTRDLSRAADRSLKGTGAGRAPSKRPPKRT